MNFEIRTLEIFDRQAKRLAKHYASFRQDYINLLQELQDIHHAPKEPDKALWGHDVFRFLV